MNPKRVKIEERLFVGVCVKLRYIWPEAQQLEGASKIFSNENGVSRWSILLNLLFFLPFCISKLCLCNWHGRHVSFLFAYWQSLFAMSSLCSLCAYLEQSAVGLCLLFILFCLCSYARLCSSIQLYRQCVWSKHRWPLAETKGDGSNWCWNSMPLINIRIFLLSHVCSM